MGAVALSELGIQDIVLEYRHLLLYLVYAFLSATASMLDVYKRQHLY